MNAGPPPRPLRQVKMRCRSRLPPVAPFSGRRPAAVRRGAFIAEMHARGVDFSVAGTGNPMHYAAFATHVRCFLSMLSLFRFFADVLPS